MSESNKKHPGDKTATDNQWVSTGLDRPNDKTERRDGPGGEDNKKCR